MTDRKWMPAEYQDEVVPPARATPSDWIVKLNDGAPALAGGDPDETPGRALKDGDVVEFDWVEDYGNHQLTFKEAEDDTGYCGLTWEIDGDIPTASAGGHMAVAEVDDWESVMSSLDEFAEALIDNNPPTPGDRIVVKFYAWSGYRTPLVFRTGAFVAETIETTATH
jgi:hypothetical protein